jgi:hypothetical protein
LRIRLLILVFTDMLLFAGVLGVLVWTVLSEKNQSLKASNQTLSIVFPVALMEKHCERVDASEIEASFATPQSLVLISFFAPVAFAIYEMLVHLFKLQSAVIKAAGSGVSTCFGSAVEHAKSYILCKYRAALHKCFVCIPAKFQDCLPMNVEESTSEKVEAIADETKNKVLAQGQGAIDNKIASHNEDLEGKIGELREKANGLFGANLLEPEETKSLTYDEYKLKQATEETRRESEMAQAIGFTLIHLGLALWVAADYYHKINTVVIGQSIMCQASKVLVMPLFTPFAVSMWNVLMTVTNYVHWENSRRKTPKDVEENDLIPAPLRPVHRNILATVVLLTTAAALSIWACAALIVAPALFGFFPIVLILLLAVPMIVLVLPLQLVSSIWSFIPDSAAQLKNKRLMMLRDIFSKLSGDGSKVESISKEELQAHWTKTTGLTTNSTRVHEFVDKEWDKFDQNHDGKVSISEFMAALGVGKEWEMSDKENILMPTKFMQKPLHKLLMAHPKLLLKVGLMQAFTTIMLIAWFGGVYYGHESWSSASKALYAELPSFAVHLALSLPTLTFSLSFALPTLDWPSTTLLFVSFGVICAEYLQKLFAWMDLKFGDSSDKQGMIQTVGTFATALIHNLG